MLKNDLLLTNLEFLLRQSQRQARQPLQTFLQFFSLFLPMVSLVFATSCLLDFRRTWAEEFSDRIVAIVNKDIITMSDLEPQLVDERKRLKAKYSGEELKRRLAQKEYDVLNTLIDRKLQLQEAEVKGIKVTEEEVKEALQQIALQKTGIPLAGSNLKKEVRETMILERLRNFQVRQSVMVTDSEITQYYQDHKEEYLVSPTYRLRQIFFFVKPGVPEAQKRSRADMVYLALRTNGNFAELARKYSDGPEAAEGGNLGEVRDDELLPPLAQALKSMKPGDISKPIKSSLGFHILALDEVTPPRPRELTEVENQIKSMLHKKRTEEHFHQWLLELKKKAFIEIKL
jgi:peptidyl-prolyl cis-trans isomerase SurA